ncbi:thyroid adenoma-associated protein-like protein, partial [Dinothrombium tinctorium]
MSLTLDNIITENLGSHDLSSISLEFQSLLSYYWLNVKESCMLLSKMVQLLDEYSVKSLSDEEILEIGECLVDVLFRCRHKGAIEACAIALTNYSKAVLSLRSKFNGLKNPVQLLLNETLEVLKNCSSLANITRRSAGIAMIIQSILCGEAIFLSENSSSVKKQDVGLFITAVNELISIINSHDNYVVRKNTDHPKALSMHILKTIISTNVLANFSYSYLEKLIELCINGLGSREWTIRNASLQLFGGCCLRILGQNKAGEDSSFASFAGTLTCKELFAKFPSLINVIDRCLNEANSQKSIKKSPQTLFPVLSLLNSLSICGLDSTVSLSIKTFLLEFLSHPFWKIRSLAARSLISVTNFDELESNIKAILEKDRISSNHLHGLMLTIKNLKTAQAMCGLESSETSNCLLSKIEPCLRKNKILHSYYYNFFKDDVHLSAEENDSDLKIGIPSFRKTPLNLWLQSIYDLSEAEQVEDTRMAASQAIIQNISEIIAAMKDEDEYIFLLYDILFR